jgi:D-amino-acid dehydrogenase
MAGGQLVKERESVTIVGAGIVGIACAHYLHKAGFLVRVIDRGTAGGACSHANCGYICPSHVLPLTEPAAIKSAIKSLFNPRSAFRVKPSVSPSLWNWLFQFARRCTHTQMLSAGGSLQAILNASMNEYRHLIPAESLDCEWKESGLLYVFKTRRGLKAFGQTVQLVAEKFQVPADRIEGDELPDFDPGLKSGLAGAFHYPGDASVRPDLLNRHWVDRLRRNGVEFIENCELSGTRQSDGKIAAVQTSLGEYSSDRYVFAMGAWSTRWEKELKCSIPIQPGKGYSVTLERPQSCPQHPMLFPEHHTGVSPFRDGFRMGSMMEFAGYDSSIPDFRIQQLRDSARDYLVANVDGASVEKWYGWRPMTWDSLPVIGRTPMLSNAYLATGHNMLGLSLAPSTGRLLAELMTNQTPHIDPDPYRPDRFGFGRQSAGA